ncbi:uncharacterized protein LOC144582934 [Callithrix jacchus]
MSPRRHPGGPQGYRQARIGTSGAADNGARALPPAPPPRPPTRRHRSELGPANSRLRVGALQVKVRYRIFSHPTVPFSQCQIIQPGDWVVGSSTIHQRLLVLKEASVARILKQPHREAQMKRTDLPAICLPKLYKLRL